MAHCMHGHSPFGLSRLVRNTLRCGFGRRLVDQDQMSAHFYAALYFAKMFGIPFDMIEAASVHKVAMHNYTPVVELFL